MPRSVGLVLAVVIFAVWTAAVLTPVSARLDQLITIALQRVASPALDVGLSLITIVGNVEVSALLALLIGIVLIRTGRVRTAAVIWVLFAAGSAFEWLAKHHLPHAAVPLALQRQAINLWHHVIHTPFGYPSGHAFRTVLLAAATWVTWEPRSGPARQSLRGALLLLAAFMGLALVYLGDHWTSEVVGGYLLAVPALLVIRAGTSQTTSSS